MYRIVKWRVEQDFRTRIRLLRAHGFFFMIVAKDNGKETAMRYFFTSMAGALCFGMIDTMWLVSDGNPACDARRAAALMKDSSP